MPSGNDFIGPLRLDEQAWAEEILEADASAALFEPLDAVIRRREALIAANFRRAAELMLLGEQDSGQTAGHRAIAEYRALAELVAASPAHCLDCFLGTTPCGRHARTERSQAAQPDVAEWRRFGADGSPSAAG
jgi:hypothetical protein